MIQGRVHLEALDLTSRDADDIERSIHNYLDSLVRIFDTIREICKNYCDEMGECGPLEWSTLKQILAPMVIVWLTDILLLLVPRY